MKSEDIVGLFAENKDFVSGEKAAKTLKVSRAAIWKKINALKQKGYVIEASPSKGYRLIQSPDLSIEKIKNSLAGNKTTIGRDIIFFDSIDSTNTTAMAVAEDGCKEGATVIADEQTGGKGRLGRKWISPAGKNLYMSIALRPQIPPRDAPILTLMSAVACASAVKRLSSIPVSIKWPNDIMVSKRKLGGILTEMKADMDRVAYAVVGIGININLETNDIPEDIMRTATSMKIETGEPHCRTEIAVEILKEMEKWYNIFMKNGKKPIIAEWSRLSSSIGHPVRVTSGSAAYTGTAEGIDDEGLLILKQNDGSVRKISAGDIALL
jgi:BirA family biotin operon repressor/biotin-[acetyl-CoA-carboxylase] ligase